MGGVLPISHAVATWGAGVEAAYFSEISKDTLAVVMAVLPNAARLRPVEQIEVGRLDQLAGQHSGLAFLCGTCPSCVGISKLNDFGRGIQDEASNLALVVKVIVQHLAAKLGENFLGLVECTDMKAEYREVYDSIFGGPPFVLCASHFAPVTRKRLWWTNVAPEWPEGTKLTAREDGAVVVAPSNVDKIQLQDALLSGWRPAALRGGQPVGGFAFRCFTRHSAASGPRPGAAGLESASREAKERWAADSWCQAPYQYEESNMVKSGKGNLRRLVAAEEELISGMPRNLTLALAGAKLP